MVELYIGTLVIMLSYFPLTPNICIRSSLYKSCIHNSFLHKLSPGEVSCKCQEGHLCILDGHQCYLRYVLSFHGRRVTHFSRTRKGCVVGQTGLSKDGTAWSMNY